MKIRIAIDGPAGTGKSTVAKKIAEKLGIDYLDTGAMYRAIAKIFLDRKLNPDEISEKTLEELFKEIKFDLKCEKLYLNGKPLGDEIRNPEVGKVVSKVASLKIVREKLTDIQKRLSENRSIVVEGRDIGTVVLPNAELKIFLTASATERAKRRFKELISKGLKISFQEVLDEILQRDKLDSSREVAPLKPAEDSIIINTDNLTIEQVVEKIFEILNSKFGRLVSINETNNCQ
ncbi:MAG: CMP/dCMP kinase [Thermotogaceae bacterium]|nr:CMP/dCMP kinase [Thermotogaceae bacterium]MDN5338227.1 CMP/dCMP kinase [Thermotogaceae bacterium]